MFFVYAIINKINNKFYVGKTSNIKSRFSKHLEICNHPDSNSYSAIHDAMNKHGKENFEIIQLDSHDLEYESYELEKYYIKLTASNKIGYNMNSGGLGGMKHNEEIKKKISDKRKGFKFTPETIQKMKDSHKNQISSSRKLSNNQVIEIREIFNYCKFYKFTINYNVLATQYNVSPYTIGSLHHYHKYKTALPNLIYMLPKNHKVCSKCHIVKSNSSFYKENRKNNPNILSSQCIECNSSYRPKTNEYYINKQKSYDLEIKIKDFIYNNKSNKEASDLFNVSGSVINRIRNKYNIQMPDEFKRSHKYINQIYDVFKLYSYGVSLNQISNILNIGRTNIFKILSGTYA